MLTPKRTGKPGALASGGRGSALCPIASLAMAMLIINPNAVEEGKNKTSKDEGSVE